VSPYDFRSVVDTIDNNTVLFVIGDHGMTNTGKLDYHYIKVFVNFNLSSCFFTSNLRM
jgi:hypothetical protein